MYYNGQVVFNLVTKKPFKVGNKKDQSTFAWSNLPLHSCPFTLTKKGKKINKPDQYGCGKFGHETKWGDCFATPKNVKEAASLMKLGIIKPLMTDAV